MSGLNSLYQSYQNRIITARRMQQRLVIQGGNTKSFYGRKSPGEILSTTGCRGIISYEPTELVITAHAGTPINDLINLLDSKGQMLPFEPPVYGDNSTIGGVVACGLSGPRRPFTGAVRDFILGIKCINGRGEIMTFGGQVMKNVAGYDLSRLMTGAMGTLGLMLEISLKVLPRPEYEITLTTPADFSAALTMMHEYGPQPLPLSGASFDGYFMTVRLSGKKIAVEQAQKNLGLDEHSLGMDYWKLLNEQKLDYFSRDENPLWRISVPSNTPALDIAGNWLIDWGGGLRWCKTGDKAEKIRNVVEQAGGHATLFKSSEPVNQVFHPLPNGLRKIHMRLKNAFDPDQIFNPGRMYAEI